MSNKKILLLGALSGVGSLLIATVLGGGIFSGLSGAFFGLFLAGYAKKLKYSVGNLYGWVAFSYLSFFAAVNVIEGFPPSENFLANVLIISIAGVSGSLVILLATKVILKKVSGKFFTNMLLIGFLTPMIASLLFGEMKSDLFGDGIHMYAIVIIMIMWQSLVLLAVVKEMVAGKSVEKPI